MTETVHGYRLSRQQRWLWPLQAAGWPATTRCEITLRGPVDRDRLAAAVEWALRRHEALRTVVRPVPGLAEPVQSVVDAPAAAGVRVQLGEPGDDGARTLTIEVPALVVDAAGLGHVAGEIAHRYAAPPGAAHRYAPPIDADALHANALDADTQYAAYSEWQHELVETPDDDAQAGAAYWRSRIAGVAATAVPYAAGGPAGAPEGYADAAVPIDDALTAAVRRHAADLGTGVEAVLLAGWIGLIAMLGGQRRVTVGATVDGRGLPELVGVAGPFTRIAPVTVTVSATGSARDLTGEVAEVLATNSRHVHHLPAGTALTAAGAATMPVGFAWTRRPEPVEAAGVTFSVRSVRSSPAPAALTLVAIGDDAGLTLELRYRPDLVAADAAETLADQYLTTLAQVIADGGARPVRGLDLYTPRAAATIAAVDATARTGGPAPSWLREFADRAATTPDAVAVRDATGELSYADLDRRSTALAAHLRGCGVGPERVVAVCHRPARGAVVAALAVMRAGAVWLPVDPAWPITRLRMIMRDARPVLLITESDLLAAAEGVAGQVLCLDEHPDPAPAAAGGAELPAADPLNLAYVLYTSGSTGTPKAVAVNHRGLDNYLDWARRAYRMTPATRSLVHSSLAFDLTITSLLAPLTAGGQVRFADPAGLEGLARAMADGGGPDLLKLTPAHLRLIPQVGVDPAGAGALRCVVIGGEALAARTLAPWRELAPRATLVNEYGPTETVVGCCTYRVEPDVPDPHAHRTAVPIGTPIDDTRLRVLDPAMRRVGIGVPGELYIGGAGVARGYRGRPDLTAERFVPDPYGEAGDRLYRTGDVVRYLPDGALEYLGRNDQQVQVNGFRVEPAEVEAVLVRHPDVAVAAVAARDTAAAPGSGAGAAGTTPGSGAGAAGAGRTLVGYVTPAPGARPDPHELREFLRTRLPSHLVPSAVVVLDELPLTGNGKVDLDRLPEPAGATPAEGGALEDPTEEAIAAVWARALGVAQVGVHDNFFDLGGHSFLLVELAAVLRSRFGTDVSVLTLLEHPTVARLAAALARTGGTPAGTTDAAPGGGAGPRGDHSSDGGAGPRGDHSSDGSDGGDPIDDGIDSGGDDAVRRARLRQGAQQRLRERREAAR